MEMTHVLRGGMLLTAATAVCAAHYRYTHSVPFMYQQMVPSTVTIQSVASKLNPDDIHTGRVQTITGQGSGFIVKPRIGSAPPIKTQIVTNFHVISDSEHVYVKRHGESYFIEATIDDAYPKNDIAILSIPFSFDNGLQLCHEDPIIGEDVFAIGSPFGFSDSVSMGVISGTERTVSGLFPDNMIQTDAMINPGSSGGPLISIGKSCVLGVNTATISEGSGVGFAVPVKQIPSLFPAK